MDEVEMIPRKKSPLLPPPALGLLKTPGVRKSNPDSAWRRRGGCLRSAYREEQSRAIGQNTFKLLFMELCCCGYKT